MTTFCGPLRRALACYATRTATIDDATGKELTFLQLGQRVADIGSRLDELSLPQGARVAVLAEGSAAYAAIYLGVPVAGRVVVPLNTRYTHAELEAACGDCRPLLLLTDRRIADLTHLAPTVMPIERFLDDTVNCAPRNDYQAEPEENHPAAIFYTGGTTDRAKGVLLSHRNKLADALSFIPGFSLTAEDRWLVMSPMFHAAGSFNVLPCVWMGATQVFLPRFDAGVAIRAIERYRITMTFGVPTMLRALVEAQEQIGADTSSLRLLGHGGAPIPVSLVERVAATFPGTEICATYGATEMAPLATIHRCQEQTLGTPRAHSVGLPVLGVDITTADPNGHPVPDGEIGELLVTGPNIMVGYWDKPGETKQVLAGRSYRSGDLGYRDADGYLYVVDRNKDMIITGGENVYGIEVEDVLCAHPGVIEAGVIGTPDDTWGELVTAIVVTSRPVTEADLDVHCRSRLAGYKIPRRYRFSDVPLPRSAAGKLLKRELRSADPPPSTDA